MLFVLKHIKSPPIPYFIRIHICRQLVSCSEYITYDKPLSFIECLNKLNKKFRKIRDDAGVLDRLYVRIANTNAKHGCDISYLKFPMGPGELEIYHVNGPMLVLSELMDKSQSWSKRQSYFYQIDRFFQTLLEVRPDFVSYIFDIYSNYSGDNDCTLSFEVSL